MKYCSAVDLTKEFKPSKEVRYEARAAAREGLQVFEVSFSEFREFYASVVSVKKTDAMWNLLATQHFTAFMAKKNGSAVSAAAFLSHEKRVYYSMAATDFTSPYSKHAGYFLQTEVIKSLKAKGYEMYIVGLLADEDDSPKLQNISKFKEQFGELYLVEGDAFPFTSYTPVV